MTTAEQPAKVIGETGRAVIANIERLRKAQRLSFRDLSAHLGAMGHPMLPSVVHRLAVGGRRIDVDDLTAFAEVLGVSVNRLLAAPGTTPPDDHPAALAILRLATCVGDFIAAPGETDAAARLDRAMRRVQLEVEELTAGNPTVARRAS